jgi:hypothetical protein
MTRRTEFPINIKKARMTCCHTVVVDRFTVLSPEVVIALGAFPQNTSI